MKAGAAFLLLLLLASAPASTQNAWVLEWLRDYAAGRHAEVAERFESVYSLGRLESDLEALSKNWLKTAPIELRRRELAAFALEAAFAQADQGPAAGRLVEWGCRQIRRIPKPGDFEHRWHLAAFAALAGAVDPDSLRGHILHVKLQFPSEPRLPFEQGVAAELSAAEFFTYGRLKASDVTERHAEAARFYRLATGAEDAELRVDAWLRLGRVELELGHGEEALAALDQLASLTRDPALRYLESLFRGQANERLGRADAARQAYETALGLRPGAHSATMALAAMLFRQGDRDRATELVDGLLGRPLTRDDPWWMYGPADFRHAAELLPAMRQALR